MSPGTRKSKCAAPGANELGGFQSQGGHLYGSGEGERGRGDLGRKKGTMRVKSYGSSDTLAQEKERNIDKRN